MDSEYAAWVAGNESLAATVLSSGEMVKFLGTGQGANVDLSNVQLNKLINKLVGGVGSVDTNFSEYIGDMF